MRRLPVRTVTAGLMSLFLIVLWIALTGVSSGRSCLGVAAGIWSSGVFSMTSLSHRIARHPDEPNALMSRSGFDEPFRVLTTLVHMVTRVLQHRSILQHHWRLCT